MKRIGITAIILVFVLFRLPLLSQEDSSLHYFNNPEGKDPVREKSLLHRFRITDSLRISQLASQLYNQENKARFYHAVGDHFYDLDEYDNARYYYSRALKHSKLTLKKDLIAADLTSLGDMYRIQDHNTIALGYLFQAMYFYRDIGDEVQLAHTLGLIGDVNRCMDQNKDALKYLSEALELALKNNSLKEQTFCYSSMGGTYQDMGEYGNAFNSYEKGLGIARSMKDTMRIVDLVYSVGDLLIDEKNTALAIRFLEEGIALSKKINDQYDLAYCYLGLSRAYLQQEKYTLSVEEGLRTYDLGISLNARGFCAEAADVLYLAYAGLRDYENAYRYLKVVKDNHDSTMSSSQIKEQAQIEMQFRNSFKEKQDSLFRASQQREYESTMKQQRMVASGGIGGLLVALLVTFIVYRSYKKEKRSREIIKAQKTIVDTKNKAILDSINYAKRIQQAIIPTNHELKNIFPESFVLLMPKDIVSGDFYWVSKNGQQAFLVVADCTGHGVPGGFMSMLATALLNEIITEKKVLEPSDILDLLKLKIVLALRQSEDPNENKDGMDIALIHVDLNTMELTFSGANNSLYLLRDKKLTEFKGDKFSIGFDSNYTQFSQQKIKVERGDRLYMFTDGYADQFGGVKGKKYKYRKLEELIVKLGALPTDEQKEMLVREHHEWRGSLEQVDDICVAGISI